MTQHTRSGTRHSADPERLQFQVVPPKSATRRQRSVWLLVSTLFLAWVAFLVWLAWECW